MAKDSLFSAIKTITEIPGPVGHEDPVQDYLAEEWAPIAASVTRTRVGNLVANVGGSGPKLLLFGHADELCLVVKSITDDGFLHLWFYAGNPDGKPPKWMRPLYQPALVVTSHGTVEGVFATASGHVTGGKLREKDQADWNDWFVDIGARSRKEVEKLGIHPGNRVLWNPQTRRIGRNIVGKAMDDRVALVIATEVARAVRKSKSLAYDLWIASTIQEENGLIGAASLADEVRFDRAVTLDVGLTGDHPGPDVRDFPAVLGGGPTVVYQDASCHYSRVMSDELVAVAQKNKIPVQRAVYQFYGSDGASLLRRGVETTLVCYPTRYTHSPIETVDESDITATIDLLVKFCTTAPGGRK